MFFITLAAWLTLRPEHGSNTFFRTVTTFSIKLHGVTFQKTNSLALCYLLVGWSTLIPWRIKQYVQPKHSLHTASQTTGQVCSLGLLFHPEDGAFMFHRNVGEHLPDYTGLQTTLRLWFFGLLLDPEDGASMFLRNVGKHVPDYTASQPTLQIWFFGLLLDPRDGTSTFLRNVGKQVQDCTETSRKTALLTRFFLDLFFNLEIGDSLFPQNVR
jgi:hypothetical protein